MRRSKQERRWKVLKVPRGEVHRNCAAAGHPSKHPYPWAASKCNMEGGERREEGGAGGRRIDEGRGERG